MSSSARPSLTPQVLLTETGRRLESEIGRIAVPIHHADPTGPTTDLTFIRLRATGAGSGPPTILLAGGPGGSGIEWLTWDDDGWPEFIAGLRMFGDVIALDQRGTGASGPVPLSMQRWDLPLDLPGDRSTVIARAVERSGTLRAYWQDRGLDASMFTTAEIADDVASLVAALGVERVGLYGISYGSHLGLAVVRRHGQLVARAVLGLVEGPDQTIKLPSRIDAALGNVAALAADAAELAGAMPDLRGEIREALASLTARPVAGELDGTTVVLGSYDLQRAIADCLGSQDDIAALPARIRSLLAGDLHWLAAETLERRTGWFPDAMYLHTDAASGASRSRRARIIAEAGTTDLGDAMNVPFPDIEAAWGYPDLGDDFRSPIVSSVPVQFYSGRLDGRTPPTNADEVMTGFATAGHLIMDGIAHDDGIISSEVRAWLLAFLAGGDPQSGAVTVPFRFRPIGD